MKLLMSLSDTTVHIVGIGTQVNDTFVIDTHVDEVTYSGPHDVLVEGFGEAYEIRGTVSGVGWGGGGVVDRARNAHYAYKIPFVARWSKANTKDIVINHHGGSPGIIQVLMREKLMGAQNPFRYSERAGDMSHGLPALLNRCAYVSTNRRGIRADGTFAATYLPEEIPPLTAVEAAALNATIAADPGQPGYFHPDEPVPLTPANDTPTFRDISRALQQVVAKEMRTRRFRTRICTGNSAGARVAASINFGRSVIGNQSVRTGGNHVVPYDAGSTRIFDGFICNSFPADTTADRVDAAVPISAPAFFIQGRGDEGYQQPIHVAYELLVKRVSLNHWIRIYEVKGLTHITRDIVETTVPPSDGDLMGTFVSAAIRNMKKLLSDEVQPPLSRIAGRIENGALVFDQAGGFTTKVQPVLEDPKIDSLREDTLLHPRIIGPADTTRWQAVTRVLQHEPDAITPPTIGCRLGGYLVKGFGAELRPIPAETLKAMYGDFDGYKDCVEALVGEIKEARLYDARVEPAEETAERARELFMP